MKYINFYFIFFSLSAFANEKCSDFLGVKVNGFVGETLESMAKSADCNDNLKTLKYHNIEGQLKTDYCSCVSANPKSISGKSLATLKGDKTYKESKEKAKKSLEEKYAKSLRNKIFGTLSRSFNFDNLAKRGYLSNDVARDKTSNNCKLDNILLNIDNTKTYAENNIICKGKEKLLEQRRKLLFPEGINAFTQNLKNTANTIAKGVRAEGSCLTYQNYLELNSTIPKNSEAVKLLQTSPSWEIFRARVAEELNKFNRYKDRLNEVRTKENDSAVAEKLWGFSGIEGRGKEVYRMLKANPTFELALRDKDYFLKVQKDLNLFESDASNGGFLPSPQQITDLGQFFNKNSGDSLKLHLESCDSSATAARTSGRGGNTNNKIGLKQSIAKFLCDDVLPTPRISEVEDSLNDSPKASKDFNEITSLVRQDLLCEPSPKVNPVFFSDIDSGVSLDTDMDLSNPKAFLADYKDFSNSFCKMIKPECKIPSTAVNDPDCNSLTEMANDATRSSLRDFMVANKVPASTRMSLIGFLKHPQFDDDTAFKKMRDLIRETTNPEPSEADYKILFQKLSLLRRHNGEVNFYRELDNFKKILPPEAVAGREYGYLLSSSGRNFLKHLPDSPEARRLRGAVAEDTSLNLKNDVSNFIFADIFTNGHTSTESNDSKIPQYASSGPEVDTDYLTKSTTTIGDSGLPPISTNVGTIPGIKGKLGTGIMPKGIGFDPKTLPKDLTGNGAKLPDASADTPSRDVASTDATGGTNSSFKIRSLDDLMARAVPPETTVTKNNDVVVKQEPSKDLVDNKGANEPNIPASGGVSKNNSWSNAVGSFGLTRNTSELEEDSFSNNSDSNINLRNNSSDSNLNSYNSTNSERIGGFGKMFDSQQGERQKILAEIKDLETKIRESRNNNMNDEEAAIREREESNSRLKQRIADLENQVDRRSRNYQNNSYNSFDNNSPYGNNNEGTPRRLDNPRDPFNRAETGREVTPEHMDTVDPAGSSLSNKGSSKGNNANKVGLAGAGAKKSNGEILESLGLKPIKKRGLASNDGEPDPETLCGFEDQELNCIFEHSEIYMRFERRQIISLVENLLLHGHTFKTIEVLSNRDPSIPKKYIVHFFEPDKNLSYEDKVKQLDLIKKMLLDYKKNYSFLKSIASKVTRTKSVEISKKEAFTILKHTLKKTDIDKLIKRRLGLIERLPANTKK